jgi:hypothetical protein
MMKKVAIVTSALFFLGGILWAVDFWEKADYTTWSQKDCEQVLTKSPWAFQYVHTNFYRPATNISTGPDTTTEGQASARLEPQSGERETRITFQFILVSAKPTRMARARLLLLQSPNMTAQAEQFVNQPASKEIPIQVQYASRPPGISAIHDIQSFFRRATINDFQANTTLTSSDSKEPIHISRYEPPTEKNAFGLFVFPRFDPSGKPYFTGKEKSITLRSDLKIPLAQRVGVENYSLFVKMEPKKMVFQNEFCM